MFALAIFVFNYLDHIVVKRINEEGIQLRGPGGAKLKTATLKRVFEIFRIATAVKFSNYNHYIIDKLKPAQMEIIQALSPPYQMSYGVVLS